MHLTDVLYNKFYPLTVLNRMHGMKRNHNNDFSLLCGNCGGGYIYHQLGVQFRSPTINLMILQPDLYRFVLNPEKYFASEMQECTNGSVPCGRLLDMKIHFTHYASYEDGKRKWEERAKRINWNNLYIMATDRDGVTPEDIAMLGEARCKKLVVFTAKRYDHPYCFQFPEFESKGQVGNVLKKTLSGKWYFEKYFDYVGWLNDDDMIAEHFRKGRRIWYRSLNSTNLSLRERI